MFQLEIRFEEIGKLPLPFGPRVLMIDLEEEPNIEDRPLLQLQMDIIGG